MRSSLFTLGAFVTVCLTSTIPSDVVTDKIPEFPDGFFNGRNNADGTTTLEFPATNQTITYKGTKPPAELERRDDGIKKRAPYGITSCWGGNNLDRGGVDCSINMMRDLFRSAPNERGYLGGRAGIQYFGYNCNGIYTYFCANTKDWNYLDNFELNDLEHALYWMDQDCGHYRPGFYKWDSPSLWGKVTSGTAICLA